MKKWNAASPAGGRWTAGRAGPYLYASAEPLVNRFTAARLGLELKEPLWQPGAKLVPGLLIRKDPTVTVKGGSVECYVLVQISQSEPAAWQAAGVEYGYSDGARFVAGVRPGWQPVPGAEGLWYRRAPASSQDQDFEVFDLVSVPATASGDQLAAAAGSELSVFAWAVQADGVAGPRQAAEQLGLTGEKSG